MTFRYIFNKIRPILTAGRSLTRRRPAACLHSGFCLTRHSVSFHYRKTIESSIKRSIIDTRCFLKLSFSPAVNLLKGKLITFAYILITKTCYFPSGAYYNKT